MTYESPTRLHSERALERSAERASSSSLMRPWWWVGEMKVGMRAGREEVAEDREG